MTGSEPFSGEGQVPSDGGGRATSSGRAAQSVESARRSSRSERPRVTIVSPHFDDAPLSLGQSLLDGALRSARARVVVVFGRTNFTRWFHPTRGRAVPTSIWRRSEEAAAQVAFHYRVRTARWEELVLRTGELDPAVLLDPSAALDEHLLDALVSWLRRLRGDGSTLLFPAGLGDHIDHRLVAAAGRRLMAEHPDQLGFYEDRPYASFLESAQLSARMTALAPGPGQRSGRTAAAGSMVPVAISGPVTERLHTLLRRCYPSQIDDLFLSAMERDSAAGACERVWFAAGEVPPWLRGGGDR